VGWVGIPGSLSCRVLTVTRRFIAQVQRPEAELALDTAALLIAAHAEPDLDVEFQLRRLDGLATMVSQATPAGVIDLLFGRLGLRGNDEEYGDPRNSFINHVLDRGVGIPISLAVLTMEVGRRAGVTFEGVGMPGHFLLRSEGELIDPYRGGRRLEVGDAETLFRRVHGDAASFSPAMLSTTGPRAILGRMLANLRNCYAERGESTALAWVARLRVAIPGLPRAERADLARLLVNVGQFAEAGDVLEQLAGSAGDAEGRRLRARASLLRARLN
jgi:regulator of sirC expression with transglutaminase-like and TPR domain